MSSVKKLPLREQIRTALIKQLGRLPTEQELHKELSEVGLYNLAESIFNPERNSILFVDDHFEEAILIPDPSDRRCSECLSYDNWKFADADWEDDRKFFRFVCQTPVDDGLGWAKCGGETTIYKE